MFSAVVFHRRLPQLLNIIQVSRPPSSAASLLREDALRGRNLAASSLVVLRGPPQCARKRLQHCHVVMRMPP